MTPFQVIPTPANQTPKPGYQTVRTWYTVWSDSKATFNHPHTTREHALAHAREIRTYGRSFTAKVEATIWERINWDDPFWDTIS